MPMFNMRRKAALAAGSVLAAGYLAVSVLTAGYAAAAVASPPLSGPTPYVSSSPGNTSVTVTAENIPAGAYLRGFQICTDQCTNYGAAYQVDRTDSGSTGAANPQTFSNLTQGVEYWVRYVLELNVNGTDYSYWSASSPFTTGPAGTTGTSAPVDGQISCWVAAGSADTPAIYLVPSGGNNPGSGWTHNTCTWTASGSTGAVTITLKSSDGQTKATATLTPGTGLGVHS